MQTQLLEHRTSGSSWRTRIVVLLVSALVGCGGGEVLLIPFFTLGFSNADSTVFLNVNPPEPTTATGNFESGTTLRIDTDLREVTGSYSGCAFTLNVGPFVAQGGRTLSPLMAQAYNGRFTGANTVELTPSAGSQPVLTLNRGGVPARPPTC